MSRFIVSKPVNRLAVDRVVVASTFSVSEPAAAFSASVSSRLETLNTSLPEPVVTVSEPELRFTVSALLKVLASITSLPPLRPLMVTMPAVCAKLVPGATTSAPCSTVVPAVCSVSVSTLETNWKFASAEPALMRSSSVPAPALIESRGVSGIRVLGLASKNAPPMIVSLPVPVVTVSKPEPSVTWLLPLPVVTVSFSLPASTTLLPPPSVITSLPLPPVTVLAPSPRVTESALSPVLTLLLPPRPVTVSTPDPVVTVLLPLPTTTVLMPLPALMTLMPLPTVMLSLPPVVVMVLLPSAAVTVSLPPLPTTVLLPPATLMESLLAEPVTLSAPLPVVSVVPVDAMATEKLSAPVEPAPDTVFTKLSSVLVIVVATALLISSVRAPEPAAPRSVSSVAIVTADALPAVDIDTVSMPVSMAIVPTLAPPRLSELVTSRFTRSAEPVTSLLRMSSVTPALFVRLRSSRVVALPVPALALLKTTVWLLLSLASVLLPEPDRSKVAAPVPSFVTTMRSMLVRAKPAKFSGSARASRLMTSVSLPAPPLRTSPAPSSLFPAKKMSSPSPPMMVSEAFVKLSLTFVTLTMTAWVAVRPPASVATMLKL